MKKYFCDKCKKEVGKEISGCVWMSRTIELCEDCRMELDTIIDDWYRSWLESA